MKLGWISDHRHHPVRRVLLLETGRIRIRSRDIIDKHDALIAAKICEEQAVCASSMAYGGQIDVCTILPLSFGKSLVRDGAGLCISMSTLRSVYFGFHGTVIVLRMEPNPAFSTCILRKQSETG